MNEKRADARAWDAILERLATLRRSEEDQPVAREPGTEGPAGGRSQVEAIYLPLVQTRKLVIAQLGQTLDGRIATHSGHSHFVTGAEDIEHLHRLRALVDAVVVGAGTAISDDPQLTVRHVRGDNPVRVVLDPSGRVPSDRKLFQDGAAPTLWLQSRRAKPPLPAGRWRFCRWTRSLRVGGSIPQRCLSDWLPAA